MVSEGNYVGCEGDRVRITGFVSEAEFDEYLAISDLVVNLRHPVMGVTSAALLRALAFGKPYIVTDIGWFSELPDSVVLKLDVHKPDLRSSIHNSGGSQSQASDSDEHSFVLHLPYHGKAGASRERYPVPRKDERILP